MWPSSLGASNAGWHQLAPLPNLRCHAAHIGPGTQVVALLHHGYAWPANPAQLQAFSDSVAQAPQWRVVHHQPPLVIFHRR